MDAQRFEALSEAYGADMARWPQSERAQAQAFCAAHPEIARTVLARADVLDAALHAWRPITMGRDLHERIVAAAPVAMRRTLRRIWLWGAGAGVGLAAAGAAGVILGVALAGPTTAVASTDEPLSTVMTGYDLSSSIDTGGSAT